MEQIVPTVLMILGIYLAFGFVFGLILISTALSKIDDGVEGTSWGFKFMIVPGMLIFWPILLVKWRRAKS